MDMPTPCPSCFDIVEFNDMVRTDGKDSIHDLVCQDCYDLLECDDDDDDDDDFYDRILPF
ncbi:hypothetical protein BTZ53_10615 [Vibrio parahaemolyticus]|uniref:hypothetical protein n=1 Tax=Vibrio parahaemolyticus TaxID=670 RepID=UPI000A36487F|nr:hypothetical protein [Vibrio parahaemolyticus]EHV9720314.1 hypothetical protein [Vibrio parahaemolyticus]OUJ46262.1 hypothetical protein BTZ53_10615 [Vibrio parahaemolyticus]